MGKVSKIMKNAFNISSISSAKKYIINFGAKASSLSYFTV